MTPFLLSIEWDIDPQFFKSDAISLGYYNFLFVGGLLICAIIIRKIYQKENLSEDDFSRLTLYCFLGIVLGARLGHCLFYEPEYYLHHPLKIILPFSFENGEFRFVGYRGLASHGGTIGLLIALMVYSRKTKISLIKTLDVIAIAAPLGGCFIRLGNLMNSEIIGSPTAVPWAFVFKRVDLIPRHPAQLYEAIAYLFFFVIAYALYLKKRQRLPKGFLFGLVLTLIFSFRFFIEFLKEQQVDFESDMTLNMGQWLSIPFVLMGLYFLFVHNKIKK